MARHASLDRPQRTYFDLLDQKYPELARPRRRLVGRGVAVRASPSRWPWIVLGLALGGLLAAGWPFLPGTLADRVDPASSTTATAGFSGRLELTPWRPQQTPAPSGEGLGLATPAASGALAPATRDPTPVTPGASASESFEPDRRSDSSLPQPSVDHGAGIDGGATIDGGSAPATPVVEPADRGTTNPAPRSADLALRSATPRQNAPTAVARSSASPPRLDVAPGRRLHAPAPEYPETTWQAGLAGRVRLEAEVDVEGRVVGTRVVEGVAPELDAAAVAALSSWRFEPAVRDGAPHSYRYRVAFDFRPPADAPETRRSLVTTSGSEPQPSADAAQQPPVRLVSPMPGYPAQAWVRGIEGEVQLRASIDTEGRVTDVRVLRGLPHGLTEAAVDAVWRWRFKPAQEGGRPVATEHDLSLRFRL